MDLSVPTTFSKRLFDDGKSAVRDPNHPCHHMIKWQLDRGLGAAQLPEPFSGRRSTARLAFVGLNPSFSDDEIIPTDSPEWSFERYDEHYRSRFADSNRRSGKPVVRTHGGHEHVPRLWGNIELFGSRFIADQFRLGEHAILVEVVHYKSLNGWLGDTEQKKRLLQHQADLTRELLDAISPCVLVPMGNDAYKQLCTIQGLTAESGRTVTEMTGQLLHTTSMHGERILIAPIKHLSYPPNVETQAIVGEQIRRAIDELN